MKRRIFIIALLLTLLGAAAWVLLRPPPAPPPVLLHPTAPQIAETEKHLAALGQEMSAPAVPKQAVPAHAAPRGQAAPRGRPGPRTLRLSEADLNVYLAESKSARKLLASHGVQAVQIVFQEPAGLVIHATVLYRRRPQNVQIDGALAADPQIGLRFTASQARVGRLPLPPAVISAGANALAARFSRQMLRRLAITVQSVSIQKKDLVIVALPLTASPRSMSPGRH